MSNAVNQSTKIEIQKCDQSHARAAHLLIERILKQEFPSESQAYPTQDLEDILQSYGSLGEAFFVAVDGERVVGTVGIKREDDRTAFLRRLFVSSDYRGKRIGEKLLERAIQFCKEVGYDEIVFKTTSTMERAIQLCKKKGFGQKAHIDLGPIQLLKFALFLKNGVQGKNSH